jgi:hypothetical protein
VQQVAIADQAACQPGSFRAIKGAMKRVRRNRFASVLSLLVVGGWIALACSNQGEGERCELRNGNDDCQDGLICNPTQYQGSNRCCPVDSAAATHPACVTPTSPITADSAPPPDTGPVPEAGPGPQDTGTEGAADANADADAGT